MDLNALIGERIAHTHALGGDGTRGNSRGGWASRASTSPKLSEGQATSAACQALCDLATVLGVSTDYLLGRTQEEHQPGCLGQRTASTATRQRTHQAAPVG